MSDIQPGPCVGCGLRNYSLSWGGPTICPACDVGSATPAVIEAQRKEIERLNSCLSETTNAHEKSKNFNGTLGKIIYDLIVGQQAAWIEWKHGKGADAAMQWIENGLSGPDQIPDEDAPYGREAQAWYDANNAHPFPQCFCGRPSNIASGGKGWCSEEHHRTDPSIPGAAK